jgi:hypothetical protein
MSLAWELHYRRPTVLSPDLKAIVERSACFQMIGGAGARMRGEDLRRAIDYLKRDPNQ